MPLLLLYCSVTVRSWIAQPHKVAASITPSILPGAHLTCFSQLILLRPPPLSRHLKALEYWSQDQRPFPLKLPRLQLATLSWLNWKPARNNCLFLLFGAAYYQLPISTATSPDFQCGGELFIGSLCPVSTQVVSGLSALRSSYLVTAILCSVLLSYNSCAPFPHQAILAAVGLPTNNGENQAP